MAQRTAKIRELLVPFIRHCHQKNIHPSDHYFEQWIDKEVKDPNYKLAVKIESIYGTCLWLMHAAIRANNQKWIKAAKMYFMAYLISKEITITALLSFLILT